MLLLLFELVGVLLVFVYWFVTGFSLFGCNCFEWTGITPLGVDWDHPPWSGLGPPHIESSGITTPGVNS